MPGSRQPAHVARGGHGVSPQEGREREGRVLTQGTPAIVRSIADRSAFEDVYAVRELLPEQFGELHPPSWHDGALSFVYEGRGGPDRRLTVSFSPAVRATDGTTAHTSVALETGQRWILPDAPGGDGEEG